MSSIKIFGESCSNLPWQSKPENHPYPIWRYSNNPIIKRNPTLKSARIFNSAVVPYKGGFVGIFRADHQNGKPQLHLGHSKDGLEWNIENEEIHWVDEKGNSFQPGYAYDPRLVCTDGTYYIIWCTEFSGPALGIGKTQDFKTFTRLENPFMPFNRNGVLFPRKFDNKFKLLSRPSDNGHTPFGDIFTSDSPDMVYWGKHRKVMSAGGNGWWQGLKIGAGPIPIETDKGWFLFYHGVCNTCNGYVYSFGLALLDRDDPSKVLYRTKDYLLCPETDYETIGFVPNVVFPCASLVDADTGRIAIYYGAADTYVAVAFAQIDELYEHLINNSELVHGDNL